MSSQPSIAIGIPTINQWNATLHQFLHSYVVDFPNTHIYIVDNGRQIGDLAAPVYQHKNNITIFYEERNIGVAASWNKLCKAIYDAGYSHAMISNDDVYSGHKKEYIINILQQFPRDLYKTSRDDWSFFILPKTTFHKIGVFDTTFSPAYFEDRDYAYRMRLCGCSVMQSIKFDPMIYKESQSSKKDPSLLDNFEMNQALYMEKWGGLPGKERFDRPYNGIFKR